MPATVVRSANAEHYTWGSDPASDAWFLLRTPSLNIIEERMPPGAAETAHHHVHARQFFFVLAGQLTLTVERQDFLLGAGDGLEIAPGQVHQASNRAAEPVLFLVTSQPPSHHDRVDQ